MSVFPENLGGLLFISMSIFVSSLKDQFAENFKQSKLYILFLVLFFTIYSVVSDGC